MPVISTASVKQMEERRDDGGKGRLANISNTFEHFLSDDTFVKMYLLLNSIFILGKTSIEKKRFLSGIARIT